VGTGLLQGRDRSREVPPELGELGQLDQHEGSAPGFPQGAERGQGLPAVGLGPLDVAQHAAERAAQQGDGRSYPRIRRGEVPVEHGECPFRIPLSQGEHGLAHRGHRGGRRLAAGLLGEIGHRGGERRRERVDLLAQGQLGLDPVSQHAGPQFRQPGRRDLGEVTPGHIGQRHAAPRRQRGPQHLHGLLRVASGQRAAAQHGEVLEGRHVHRIRRHGQPAPTRVRLDQPVQADPAQLGPQPRNQRLQGITGMPGRVIRPDPLSERR
jgi:hypothetical protein